MLNCCTEAASQGTVSSCSSGSSGSHVEGQRPTGHNSHRKHRRCEKAHLYHRADGRLEVIALGLGSVKDLDGMEAAGHLRRD